jgi:hypothetical protein
MKVAAKKKRGKRQVKVAFRKKGSRKRTKSKKLPARKR